MDSIQNQTDIVIIRTYNTSSDILWKAWTDSNFIKKWFGPENFTIPECSVDLRVGGKIITCMRSPEGQNFWSMGEYRELIPEKKIICTDSFADEMGNPVPASYYGMSSDFPMEMLIEVTFKNIDGKTEMTLRHSGLPDGEIAEQTKEGWSQSFDKLERAINK